MRILSVTSSYPRYRKDLAGRFVWEMNRALEREGHCVEVATWRDGEPGARRGSPLPHENVERVGYAPAPIETLFYGAGTIENLRRRPLRAALIPGAAATMVMHLIRRVRKWDPDVLVGHWLVPAGAIVRIVGEVFGIPSLTVAHSGGVHVLERMPRPVRQSIGALFSGDDVITTSEPLRRKLHRVVPGARGGVVPMGYPSALERTGKAAGGRGDVLYMGRFAPIKGPERAIEAGSRVLNEYGAVLRMAGRGPLEERVVSRARDVECEVEVSGPVVGPEKRSLLSRCSAALFPSTHHRNRHEGLPVSLLEASAAGVVPFVGAIPGAEEVVAQPKFQMLDDAGPAEWSRRLRQFGELPSTRRSQLVAETRDCVREYAWPRLIDTWERHLRRAASRPVGRRDRT